MIIGAIKEVKEVEVTVTVRLVDGVPADEVSQAIYPLIEDEINPKEDETENPLSLDDNLIGSDFRG